MKTILAAVDSSPISDAVVAAAVDLARSQPGRVVLLTVVQPPIITSDYAPIVENYADILAAGEKAAASRLDKLRQRIAAEGIPVDTVQQSGAPVPLIVEEARKSSADFIVMGSHGHGAMYDLLVGSTTHGVLLRAACPVVIIPPKDKRPARG